MGTPEGMQTSGSIEIPDDPNRFETLTQTPFRSHGSLALVLEAESRKEAGLTLEDPNDVRTLHDRHENTIVIDLDGSGFNVGR